MSKHKTSKIEESQALQFLSRNDLLTAIALSTLTLIIYAFTAAPGVTLEDSGDFINGVLTLGIVHPPGYPLYTVLGHLFSFLPLGDPAFRVNLFSALWGALCLGIMFLNFRILSIGSLYALFAPLCLGFTGVFWSKAVVAEVYTFNGFLLASIVFWILSYNRDKKKFQLYLAFLTTGLTLSNHYPLTILSGVGLVFLLDRRDLKLWDFVKGSLLLGLGLTPYLYLFIQAMNPDVQYNFGKNTDFGMVVDHILRKNYPSQFGGTLWDKCILAWSYLKSLIAGFWFSSLFLFSGIILSFRQRWRYRYPFLLAALAPSLGLILILAVPSHDQQFKSYLLDFSVPSYLFFSIFLAVGLQMLMSRYVKASWARISLLVILLIPQVVINFRTTSHHNDHLVHLWGTEILNSLPPNSILILCAPGNFAIQSLHLTRGIGPEVTVYDRFSGYTRANLYAPNLLFKMKDGQEYRKRRERQLIDESKQPIYYTCKNAIDELGVSFSYTPFVFRADNNHREAADSTRFSISDGLLENLVHGYPISEYWLDRLRRMIFSRLIAYYGGHNRPEISKVLEYFKQSKFYSQPHFVLSLANNLYFFQNYKLSRSFYERADQLSPQAFSSTDLAVYCNLLANAKDFDKALGICSLQERRSRPCDNNTVTTRQTIAGIYRKQGQWPKVAQYARKILECQPDHSAARNYLEAAAKKIP